MQKSATFLLWGRDDNANGQLKEKFTSLLLEECASIFPEELQIATLGQKPGSQSKIARY